MDKKKSCEDSLIVNKILDPHTKNILKDIELEEKDLLKDICKNLDKK